MAENFLVEMCATQFHPTGETREVLEYRDRDGGTWYRLAEGESPSPQVAETRTVKQQRIQQQTVDGTVTSFWQTQD